MPALSAPRLALPPATFVRAVRWQPCVRVDVLVNLQQAFSDSHWHFMLEVAPTRERTGTQTHALHTRTHAPAQTRTLARTRDNFTRTHARARADITAGAAALAAADARRRARRLCGGAVGEGRRAERPRRRDGPRRGVRAPPPHALGDARRAGGDGALSPARSARDRCACARSLHAARGACASRMGSSPSCCRHRTATRRSPRRWRCLRCLRTGFWSCPRSRSTPTPLAMPCLSLRVLPLSL